MLIPPSDPLPKRGRAEIVRLEKGPNAPNRLMLERYFHSCPMGPSPDNVLGTHFVYLSWPAYLIYRAHHMPLIGTLSTNGCGEF